MRRDEIYEVHHRDPANDFFHNFSLGSLHLIKFDWGLLLGNCRLRSLMCELSLGIFSSGDLVWAALPKNFHLISFDWELALAWALFRSIFRLGTFAWNRVPEENCCAAVTNSPVRHSVKYF